MGQELELKYAAPDADTLDRVLHDGRIRTIAAGRVREIRMRTTYYDTPEGWLSQRKWMLRLRMENSRSVVCCKTPLPGSNVRGEWETACATLEEAIPQLIARGAPAELAELHGLQPVCSAAFTRRALDLAFDGSSYELACDLGELRGMVETLPLCEMEMELKSGSADSMERFAESLAETYGLTPEPRSKVARARSLR